MLKVLSLLFSMAIGSFTALARADADRPLDVRQATPDAVDGTEPRVASNPADASAAAEPTAFFVRVAVHRDLATGAISRGAGLAISPICDLRPRAPRVVLSFNLLTRDGMPANMLSGGEVRCGNREIFFGDTCEVRVRRTGHREFAMEGFIERSTPAAMTDGVNARSDRMYWSKTGRMGEVVQIPLPAFDGAPRVLHVRIEEVTGPLARQVHAPRVVRCHGEPSRPADVTDATRQPPSTPPDPTTTAVPAPYPESTP